MFIQNLYDRLREYNVPAEVMHMDNNYLCVDGYFELFVSPDNTGLIHAGNVSLNAEMVRIYGDNRGRDIVYMMVYLNETPTGTVIVWRG